MKAERKPTKKGVRIKNKCPCAPSARDLSQQLQQTLTIPADVMAAAGQQPGRPRGRPGPTPTHRHRARDQRAHALHDHEANSFNTPPTSTTPALERTVTHRVRQHPRLARRPASSRTRAQVKTRVDGENLYTVYPIPYGPSELRGRDCHLPRTTPVTVADSRVLADEVCRVSSRANDVISISRGPDEKPAVEPHLQRE